VPEPVLSLRGVVKRFPVEAGEPLEPLRGVSLDVAPGRAVALIGRSGSGKSTLLHLAAGIDAPSEGSVRLLGQELGALSDRERTLLRRASVGIVFQFFHLLPHLSAEENVLLPARVAGDAPGPARERARDLLRRAGLSGREADPVRRLSGGEMQRVALCRALLRRPRLLLADEPTGNLDERSGQVVMDLLLALAREEGSALLCATHSRELAAQGDETWRLQGGLLERA
jgi:predicted ABC-type transport system involved in lysophospholipase L1 biosynthesis ATPase subunit